METKKKTTAIQSGILIIISALIWGAVIVGCSLKLRGTECYDQISTILFIGVIMHFILIWTPMGIYFKNKKLNNKVESIEKGEK